MTDSVNVVPFAQVFGLDGLPLDNGKIYIGTANQDPQFNPVQVYWDAAASIPAAQPIRTVAGYISYNGAPARLYVSGNYSLRVSTKNDQQVYYVADVLMIGTQPALTPLTGLIRLDTYAALRAYFGPATAAYVAGRTDDQDGAAGNFAVDEADTTSADNDGTIIVDANGRRWKRQYSEQVNAKWFGAKGDGVADDRPAIVAALALGLPVYLPEGIYLIGAMITLQDGSSIIGDGITKTSIRHSGAFDFFTMGTDCSLTDLYIDDSAGAFSGRGLVIGDKYRQKVSRCKIVTKGFPVEFTTLGAGSQCMFDDVNMNWVGAVTGSAQVAVNMVSGTQLSAVPRTFTKIQTNGAPSFNFGGCNDVFVSDSFLGDLIYTTNSRGVLISNSRLSNQPSIVVDGHNGAITGCAIAGQITIANGADGYNIDSTYNQLPVIDNSGNNRNLISFWPVSYTPVISTAGGGFSLGNGTVSGVYSRNGSLMNVAIEFTVGSTTSFGAGGGIQLGLPLQRRSTDNTYPGVALIQIGGTSYVAAVQLAGNVGFVQMLRDSSGTVTNVSPAALVAGSIIRATITYNQ